MSLDVERLYALEYDRLCAYFSKRLPDPADAPDFAQTVFLRVWEKRHRYRPLKGVPPSSWLYRIAGNLLVDTYRPGGYARHGGYGGHVRLGSRQPAGYDAGSDEHVEQLDVSIALETYQTGRPGYSPAKQLAVIRERFFVGGTDEEIGARLGMTKQAAKKTRGRAQENLKKALEEVA